MCLKTTPFFLYALILFGFLLSACNIEIGGKKNKDEETEIAAPVIILPIERGKISDYMRMSAVLEPLRQVEIFAQSAGTIVKLSIEEGAEVEKGQLLVYLDSADQRLSVERAEALLERERNNLARAKELHDRNMLSPEEYQRAQLVLRDAELSMDQAQLALDRTRITAPFSGIIAERFIDYGDQVSPSRPLFRLVDRSILQLNVWFNESDLPRLRTGQTAEVFTANNPVNPFTARLIRISPVVDPTYGKLKVTFKITNPPTSLKPGQFVELQLTLETRHDVLVIPKRSLVYEAGAPVVFVCRDTLAFRRPVEIGLETGEFAEVTNGVQDGDMIVVDGQATLRDSTVVKVVASDR